MNFHYKDDTHIYTLDDAPIPSLTGMLAADGLADDLKFVKPEVLEAKRDWGTRLHLALQKVEYGFGIDPDFKQHCVDWLDLCRRMKWMRDGVPIWKNCELPALARYEGFVFGFTPDRAHPDAIVEIKGTYSPSVSHGIQVALQVIGMEYPRDTPRLVVYFDREGIKKVATCQPTVKRDNQQLDVFSEAERIIFTHALAWEEPHA
jgi:hypothetical protein